MFPPSRSRRVEVRRELPQAWKFSGWCQNGYQAGPIWTSSISRKERGLYDTEQKRIRVIKKFTNKKSKGTRPYCSPHSIPWKGISSPPFPRATLVWKAGKTMITHWKKIKREFVMKRTAGNNGPSQALQRTSVPGRDSLLWPVECWAGSHPWQQQRVRLLPPAPVCHATGLPRNQRWN